MQTDFVVFDTMLKAIPKTDGRNRYIFMEASNESVDIQQEIILCSALKASADYFLKFGNLDIDHYTMIGPQMGIANSELYEVGRPVDVSFRNNKTFVKAQLFDGNSKVAEKANHMWESMTAVNPPVNWFPSVGGAILQKEAKLNPDTGDVVNVATAVRWSNIGMSRTPVNPNLPTAQASPIAVFCKSLGAYAYTAKSLTAGYGSDMANLSGGSALRVQSLDGGNDDRVSCDYFSFRSALSSDMMSGAVKDYTRGSLESYSIERFGISPAEATHWVNRFYRDLKSGL